MIKQDLTLNQYLSPEELKKIFSDEEWDSLELTLTALLSTDDKPEHILRDPKLLGAIHHAANLDQYEKKDFRKNLLLKVPPLLRERYFKHCGITEPMEKMSFEKRVECIKETSEFEWGDNEKTKNFLNFFGYPDYLIPNESAKKKINETIFGGYKNYKEEKFQPLKMLHDYQSSIVVRAMKEIEKPNCHCLIQMPTGTGKTRVAMEILAQTLNQDQPSRIVWLANKIELLEQAHDAFIEVWNHVGKHPIEIFNIWGTANVKSVPKTNTVIFTSYGKLNNLLDRGVDLKSDYVVVDEAHQILAPTYKDALRKISSFENETRVIGLTATPGRGIDDTQNLRLVSEFQRNIVGLSFSSTEERKYRGKILQYLEDREILAKTVPKPLKTDFEFDLSSEEWEKLSKLSLTSGDRPEYNESSFKKMANDSIRNTLIIRELKALAEEGKKILYFSTTKKQSFLVYTVLQQLGVKAIHVSGETDPRFRTQIIKKFKDTDDINVICNYDIFSTGFDVPKLDVVFIARPVNSPVLFNQMIGRGTRGIKMGGKSTYTLIQVIDKIPSRFIGFDPYSQYGFWDVHWKNNLL